MPTVQGNGIDIYYEVQGEGEPLVLLPYLAIDQACYAFQVAEYAKHFACYTVDLRGAGLSGKPEGTYTTELFADDIAAFMDAANVERAHVAGLSLGAATGMWVAAKHPSRVKSLSLRGVQQPHARVPEAPQRIAAGAGGIAGPGGRCGPGPVAWRNSGLRCPGTRHGVRPVG
jgi:pimeloyl-ACP methyl ester carboxylesterase